MKKSSSFAATKTDLAKVKSDLTLHIARVKSELKSDLAQSKAELIRHVDVKTDAVQSELTSQIVEAKSELIRYIDLKHEQLLYDFRGIFADRTVQQNDKIADHEHRIHRVERKVGLAA